MVETSKPNFSGAPIRPKGPKREQAKGPFLAHAWRFLTDRELAVPPHAPPRPPVDDAAIEALVQSRVEASLEASVAQVPLRFGRSVDGGDSRGLPPPAQRDSDGPGLDAESAEALNERTLQTFGAPSHVSSFSALSQQREPPAPGRSRRPRALTEHGNLFDDRADELLSQRVEAGVARLGEPEWEPTVHNGGLERLRPPAPIVIWRPPEMVRIATNIPPELDKPRVDARFATLLKKNADVRASFRTPSASAGLKDSELRSPRPVPVKGSPRARKLLEAQRANVAVDQLRSTHALQLKNSNAKPPRQCVKYGAWYMPTNQWQPVFAENTSDAAADGAAALASPSGAL